MLATFPQTSKFPHKQLRGRLHQIVCTAKCLDDLPSSLDRGGTVKDSAVPGTSSLSDSCLFYIAHPKKRCHSRVVQSLTLMNLQDETSLRVQLPPIPTIPASSSSLSPTYVSSVSLIMSVRTVYSLSPFLWRVKPDVERLLTEERSRLICVSLLIDSLH